jgi:hypothetical protein
MRLLLGYTIIAGLCSAFATGLAFGQGGYGTTFAVDLAFPAGVFAESFKPGIGGHVDFYMESEDYLRISVLLGYTHWGIDNDKINAQYRSLGGTGTLQLEGRMNAFPVLLGVKLLSPPGGFRFYGVLDVGVSFFSGKVTGEKIENGVVTQNIYDERSKSVAAANLGVGFLLPVAKDVCLDVAGRYHFVKRDSYYNYDYYGNASEVSTDKYFTLALGVTYAFDIP